MRGLYCRKQKAAISFNLNSCSDIILLAPTVVFGFECICHGYSSSAKRFAGEYSTTTGCRVGGANKKLLALALGQTCEAPLPIYFSLLLTFSATKMSCHNIALTVWVCACVNRNGRTFAEICIKLRET